MFKWVCIENAVSVVCFTVLAVIFDHWWIVLFSVFFMSSVKQTKKEKKEGEDNNDE